MTSISLFKSVYNSQNQTRTSALHFDGTGSMKITPHNINTVLEDKCQTGIAGDFLKALESDKKYACITKQLKRMSIITRQTYTLSDFSSKMSQKTNHMSLLQDLSDSLKKATEYEERQKILEEFIDSVCVFKDKKNKTLIKNIIKKKPTNYNNSIEKKLKKDTKRLNNLNNNVVESLLKENIIDEAGNIDTKILPAEKIEITKGDKLIPDDIEAYKIKMEDGEVDHLKGRQEVTVYKKAKVNGGISGNEVKVYGGKHNNLSGLSVKIFNAEAEVAEAEKSLYILNSKVTRALSKKGAFVTSEAGAKSKIGYIKTFLGMTVKGPSEIGRADIGTDTNLWDTAKIAKKLDTENLFLWNESVARNATVRGSTEIYDEANTPELNCKNVKDNRSPKVRFKYFYNRLKAAFCTGNKEEAMS